VPKYVVIGDGVAGLSALKALRAIDSEGDAAIVSAEGLVPYSKVLLIPYIANKISEEKLNMVARDFYASNHVEVLLGARAAALDASAQRVFLSDGGELRFQKLLIASGGDPTLPSQWKEVPGILGLRTLADARCIRAGAHAGKRIVISGGGLVAVKLAAALTEVGIHAELIVSSTQILSQAADYEGALMVQRRLEEAGATITPNASIAAVDVGPAGVRGVSLKNGKEIPCQLLVYCKGVTPNTQFMGSLVPAGAPIAVDSRMRSAFPDIYAAGDVAMASEVSRQQMTCAALWPHATVQGRIAGRNMAGQAAIYRGSLVRNAMEICGLPFISMGIINEQSGPDWDVKITRLSGSYCKLVYRGEALVGAVLIKDAVTIAGRLQAEIRKAAAAHASSN